MECLIYPKLKAMHQKNYPIFRRLLLSLAFCSLGAFSANAQFSGLFDPANWTISEDPVGTGGSVDIAGAPGDITIVSGDNGNFGGNTDFSIVIPADGFINLSWSYTTVDGAEYDYPQYVINGVETLMPGYDINAGGAAQSGVLTIPVLTGQSFALRMTSADGVAGPGTAIFSNFSGPSGTGCSTVTAGVAAASASTVCLSQIFNVSASGFTNAAGISFQWESSPSGLGTWTLVPNATSPSLVVSGLSANTDYRVVVTCSNGGANDVSNEVTVSLGGFANCYCSPLTGNTLHTFSYNYLNNVTVLGTTLNSSNPSTGPGGYLQLDANIASNTATFTQGVAYSMDASMDGNGLTAEVWIDYDQSGTFDANEFTGLAPATGANILSSGLLMIPITATPGQTGMRVRANYYSFADNEACYDPFYDGETEDYIITIDAALPCAGAPVAGTISGPSAACPGAPFNLSVIGQTNGLGITLEWQSSPMGANTWTPILGAGSIVYNEPGVSVPTDYRLVITCANGGGQDISNVISISMNTFEYCYCSPLTGVTLHSYSYNYLYNVTIPGTTLNSSNTSVTNTGYLQLNPNVPSNTADLSAGVSYLIETTVDYQGYTSEVWIDFDHSGTFEPSEYATLSPANTALLSSGYITVPLGATLGQTGMRVRANYDPFMDSEACYDPGDGETEDYIITISPAPSCFPAGYPATAAVLANSADLNWGASLSAPADGYEWAIFPQGSGPAGTPLSSGTTTTAVTNASVSGLTATTDYTFYVRSICSPVDASAWVSIDFTSACATFTAPYTETFDVLNTPNCWDNSGPELWEFTDGGGPDYGLSGSADNTGNGGGFAWVDGSGSGLNQDITLLSPNIDISVLTNPRLRYYVKSYNVDDNALNKLIVQGLDNGVWVELDSIQMNFPNAAWQERTASLTGFTSAITQIRFVVDEDNSLGDAFYNDILIDDISVEETPSCVNPNGLAVNNITVGGADVSWNAVVGAAGYEYVVNQTFSAPAGSGTQTTNLTEPVSGLNGGSAYYLHVRTDCGGGDFSTWSVTNFQTLIGNDEATGAVTLTVNGGCTGAIYTNTGASQSASEVYGSCSNIEGYATVWYQFVAPVSGAVRVSTDLGNGTLEDTRVALFSATNVNDYTTFTSITCDEDGGNVVGNGYTSVLYATDLTAGQTYYIQIDGYGSGDEGTFCLAVDELSSSMIGTLAGSCESLQSPVTFDFVNYDGWLSLLDENSNLVAMVRNTAGGDPTEFYGSLTVNSSSVRDFAGQYYLDRNYEVGNGSISSPTPIDMKFFFLASEVSDLSAAMGGGGTSLADLNVTHQATGGCEEDFDMANGTATLLSQTANGSVGGVNWITVNNTQGFSSFFIMAGINPLSIDLKDVSAVNIGSRNRVDWSTASGGTGDRFEVERSADGRQFIKIGEVAGKNAASIYSFWDENPVKGVNYYRLRMTEASGEFSYSRVVSATVQTASGFIVDVYPNPVADQLTVKVYGTQGSNPMVSVCDVTGKVLSAVEVMNGEVKINMSQLAQGVYLIKYSDANHSNTIKVTRQ
jgi:hypothetical protein